ncbi:MAG TPA: helicase-related protein, partial [Methanomassiliicoccales archaeon]|nr:helicase-related protein [Methanomassiliicoccales archaeon]
AEHARQAHKSFERVLILCKSSLLKKWQEELSRAREKGQGFLQYLTDEYWPKTHPFRRLLPPQIISRRASADDRRAMRDDGRLQAQHGIYIVNPEVLTERNRIHRPFLKRLYATFWDLIIVDEAHHYARWTKPAYIFAPDGDMTNYDQGVRFRKILALTATPFELDPREMVQLLALVRADKGDLETLKKGLDLYVQGLEQFFSLRRWSETDPQRQAAVSRLRKLRVEDALDVGSRAAGLESILRRYLIRNTKQQNERRYFLVNKIDGKYESRQFDKLEDLRQLLAKSPLLPFDGPDALFYLELRELIAQTSEQAREHPDTRTFITMELRQGLSSYPQVETSKPLRGDLESAHRLKKLVHGWNTGKERRLHPKVQALADVVAAIATAEVQKVETNPATWVSKVLVFSKLISGTAPQLRKVLHDRLEPIFADFLARQLRAKGWGARDELAGLIRECMRTGLASAKTEMSASRPGWCLVPDEFGHEDLAKHHRKHLVDAYRDTVLRRAEQSLFLAKCVLDVGKRSDALVRSWVDSQVVAPLKEGLEHVVDDYLEDQPDESRDRDELFKDAEEECIRLLEEQQSIGIVGRFDGANNKDREAHRRNFNRPFNPFVLLVSRVGEEGIDLQEQCRYVIHYDLEWNPAKMEQREGRVDREGWGRAGEEFIDVRFQLLKGTYEERIFHAVMQRDRWFQVLIGSKRKELGQIDV